MFLILTDFHRGSFKVIGDCWAKTLSKYGKVTHLQTPQTEAQRNDISNCFSNTIVFHNTLGHGFVPIKNCHNIALPAHEWSRCPIEWVKLLEVYDQIWVTTSHVQEILKNSGLKKRAEIIPPILYDEDSPEKDSWQFHNKINFLFIGEPHFRKGHHFLMEGYMQAFPKADKATLTIKTSPSCEWQSPREDIFIIKEFWERDKLLDEYRKHDCFLSASLGEGLGLPVLEAINSLLPICTNYWGGHISLLKMGYFFEIKHEEIIQPFTSDPAFYAERQKCAYSSPKDIKEAILQFCKSNAIYRESVAKNAKKYLIENYGSKSVYNRISKSLI
jgi:glycosyltransferase involved in cell wall biosynthesis